MRVFVQFKYYVCFLDKTEAQNRDFGAVDYCLRFLTVFKTITNAND